MKSVVFIFSLFLTLTVRAHDEGHGPKLTDSPKQGGVIAPVVLASEADKGPKAALIYKAELVRTGDGKVLVYLYDKEMKNLSPSKFDKKANGILEVIKKKKITKTPFILGLEGDAFSGTPPKASSKPYNIDIRLKEDGRELLTAFDNLD